MKTRILMEEMYATLSAPYLTLECKTNLIDSINEAVLKFKITPDFYVKPFSQNEPGKGKIVIEFSPAQDRTVGEFFEFIIAENGLECEKIRLN